MSITISCPKCARKLAVPDTMAGRSGRCPCGASVAVPAKVPPTAPVLQPEPMPARAPAKVPARAITRPLPAEAPPPAPTPQVAVQVNVAQQSGPQTSHSLGIGALVLGILALFTACIPVVSLPMGVLGLALGGTALVLALARKGSGIGFAISGGAVSLIAVIVAGVWGLTLSSTISALSRRNDPRAPATGPQDASKDSPQEATKDGTKTAAPDGTPKGDGGAEPATPAIEWADALAGTRAGDVKVSVASVEVGRVRVKGFGGEVESKDANLLIHVRIENGSETRKVEYRSWGQADSFGFGEKRASELVDNFGNTYKSVGFSVTMRPVGQLLSESVYPGKSVDDLLVFEVPVDKAEFLRLTLPANAFGGKGMIRLQIPKDAITDEAHSEAARQVRERREEEARQAENARHEKEAQVQKWKEEHGDSETTVAAEELVNLYSANQVAADRRFKGKYIRVTGAIDELGKDIMNCPYVNLTAGTRQVRRAQCVFEKSDEAALAALKKGQRISIVGRCDGLMGNVLVRMCRIE